MKTAPKNESNINRPSMPKSKLLSVGGGGKLCEVVELGKYWGFRCGEWLRVEVFRLPIRGGTGEIAYAPIDRRGYPYAGGIAISDCEVMCGPVKNWGSAPPKVSRKSLLGKGADNSFLTHKVSWHKS